jgi:hypothetical protein
LNAFFRISIIADIGKKRNSEYDYMHIQLLTGFIPRFFHISGQHGFLRESTSGFFGRPEGFVRTCCGREKKGTGGSIKALGAKKAALKILRFTLFVVSQACDLVKKDILQTRCDCV